MGLWDWVLSLTIVLSDDDSDNLRYIRIRATRNILNVIDIFCNIFYQGRRGLFKTYCFVLVGTFVNFSDCFPITIISPRGVVLAIICLKNYIGSCKISSLWIFKERTFTFSEGMFLSLFDP